MDSVIWIQDNSAGLSAVQVKSQVGIKQVSKYWIIYQHIYQHNIRSTRMNYEETNLSLFRIKCRVLLIP